MNFIRTTRNCVYVRFLFFAILSFSGIAKADYQSPVTVVSGKFGDGPGEFSLVRDGVREAVPTIRCVDVMGNIVMSDLGKINVFNSSGKLTSSFEPKNISKRRIWPSHLACSMNEFIYTSNYDNKLQKYEYSGKLVWEKDVSELGVVLKGLRVLYDGRIVSGGYKIDNRKRAYILFSSEGEVLGVSNKDVQELGITETQKIGKDRYSITVTYPDKKWQIAGTVPCRKYIRIGECELYCPGDRQVFKYSEDGEEFGRLTLPENRIDEVTRGVSVEPLYVVKEEYGKPVISPVGDVYTWKRTQKTYSIIKWVWIDGPDAPMIKSVEDSGKGILVNWRKPEKDARLVREYEVERAEDVCGLYVKIGETKPNALRFIDKDAKTGITYYYRVRAVTKKGAGGFSNKVAGKKE